MTTDERMHAQPARKKAPAWVGYSVIHLTRPCTVPPVHRFIGSLPYHGLCERLVRNDAAETRSRIRRPG